MALPLDPGTARHGPPSSKRLAGYRKRLQTQRRNRMNELADLLAAGWTTSAAAREMGIAQQTASSLFRDMCAGLGEQAR